MIAEVLIGFGMGDGRADDDDEQGLSRVHRRCLVINVEVSSSQDLSSYHKWTLRSVMMILENFPCRVTIIIKGCPKASLSRNNNLYSEIYAHLRVVIYCIGRGNFSKRRQEMASVMQLFANKLRRKSSTHEDLSELVDSNEPLLVHAMKRDAVRSWTCCQYEFSPPWNACKFSKSLKMLSTSVELLLFTRPVFDVIPNGNAPPLRSPRRIIIIVWNIVIEKNWLLIRCQSCSSKVFVAASSPVRPSFFKAGCRQDTSREFCFEGFQLQTALWYKRSTRERKKPVFRRLCWRVAVPCPEDVCLHKICFAARWQWWLVLNSI